MNISEVRINVNRAYDMAAEFFKVAVGVKDLYKDDFGHAPGSEEARKAAFAMVVEMIAAIDAARADLVAALTVNASEPYKAQVMAAAEKIVEEILAAKDGREITRNGVIDVTGAGPVEPRRRRFSRVVVQRRKR